jgi:hypothetical protein
VQEEHRRALEWPAQLAAMGSEFLDDLRVEVAHVALSGIESTVIDNV